MTRTPLGDGGQPAADPNGQLLASLALFRGLEPEWLERLGEALERVHLRGGQTLMVEGEPGDAMFILVHGRLRAFARTSDGGEALLNDISAGEIVGELALLATDVRTSTVRALRDSTLLRLPADAFHRFVRDHPEALLRITRAAITRIQGGAHLPPRPAPKTLALIAAGASVLSSPFIDRLVQGLDCLGKTMLLTSEIADAALGPGAAQTPAGAAGDAELIGWLHQIEQSHTFVVYQSGPAPDLWWERCLRQADAVLLVGDAEAESGLDPREVNAVRLRPELFPADAVLVLVHDDRVELPSGSLRWLADRVVRCHLHVRRGRQADYERIARLLTGHGVGLVLSGGVARGFAHLGVMRALEELAIPVDSVAGASFGAVAGAGIALEWGHEEIRDRLVLATVADGSLLDFSAPVAALTSGRRVTNRLQRAFGGVCIEDLWRPYACVSSDLSTARAYVHTRGPAWRAMRASVALPGIFPPVRSPENTVLVDGSLMNNLPVDVVQEAVRGGRIIAVDVNAPARFRAEDLPMDGIVSGWHLWLARLNPFRTNPRVPSLVHVLAGATMVGTALSIAAKIERADLVLTPPIEDIGLLRFDRHRDAMDAGYRHAMERLPEWQRNYLHQAPGDGVAG